jgi:hypothetical protein
MWNQHVFGRVFVHRNFPQAWIKGPLAQKRSEHLAEDQAAVLPTLQDKAVEFKHFHRITVKDKVRPFRTIYNDLKKELKHRSDLIAQGRDTEMRVRRLHEEYEAACIVDHDKPPSASEIYAKVERVLRERRSAEHAIRANANASTQILRRIRTRIRMVDNAEMIEKASTVAEAADVINAIDRGATRREALPELARRASGDTATDINDPLHDDTLDDIELDDEVDADPGPSTSTAVQEEANAPKVVCKCPLDGCDGFVLKEKGGFPFARCKMCELAVCVKCHKACTSDEKHECNPDDLESIRLISQTTKRCPWEGCGTPITKSSGCDQMWCTSCKRGFYWSTLRKHVGQGMHNPHYFEFVRAQAPAYNRYGQYGGRYDGYDSDPEPEEGGCCDDARPFSWGRVLEAKIPQTFTLHRARSGEGQTMSKSDVRAMLTRLNHAIDSFGPRRSNYLKTDYRPQFEVLNVQKVAGSIDEAKWKQELVRLDRSAQFSRDVYEVVVTFVRHVWTTFRELRRLAKTLKSALFLGHLEDGIESIHALREEINEELRKVGVEYHRNYPTFNEQLEMSSTKI